MAPIGTSDDVLHQQESVKEYKRTCNQCGKTWHSLVSREAEIEKSLESQQRGVLAGSCAACCGSLAWLIPTAIMAQSAQSRKDLLDKLRKCPECSSTNYVEEIISYAKKP